MSKIPLTQITHGDLSIKSITTSKDKIEQPELAKDEKMFIPPLGSSIIISGKSGSGKTTLLNNLLTDGRFYGKSKEKPHGWFDKIFLFSPTANGDDVQRSLNIPKKYVFTDLDEAPQLLEIVLDSQQKKIDKAKGAQDVQQFAVIFDDVIGNTKFMNSKAFTRCFYQVRHVNCTTFICTQHFKRVPKICRLQANFIFFFQGSQSEVETIAEEFAPPRVSKKTFMKFVDEVTNDKFAFLTVNMKTGVQYRFRKNLDTFADFTNVRDDHEQKFVSLEEKEDALKNGVSEQEASIEERAQLKRKRVEGGSGDYIRHTENSRRA